MKRTYKHKSLIRQGTYAFLSLFLFAVTTFADVDAILTKHNGQRIRGATRWKGSQKVYVVMTKRQVVMQVPGRDVREAKPVRPPKGLQAAIKNVRSGSPARAITPLKTIMRTYKMLYYDSVAAEWLAKAYYKNNQADEAIRAVDNLMSGGGKMSGELMKFYCDALRKAKKYDKLQLMLTKMIETGSRSAAAVAQIKRGDIDMDKGDVNTALVDGYLRTIILFRDIKEAQPEALYKAMKAFKAKGQHSHAEKMRKKLLAEHPKSSYSRQASG